jgi:hypothetical protein
MQGKQLHNMFAFVEPIIVSKKFDGFEEKNIRY